MTLKEKILKYLKDPEAILSCAEICNKIIKEENLDNGVRCQLNASVSSVLKK